MKRLWWLSFVDAGGFRGCTLVEGEITNENAAWLKAVMHDAAPPGAAAAAEITAEDLAQMHPVDRGAFLRLPRNRFLTLPELEQHGVRVSPIMEHSTAVH